MVISFPIPVDVHQLVFGSILASMHERTGLVDALRQTGLVPPQEGDGRRQAAQLQRHLYHSTIDDLIGTRLRLGNDLYAPCWFLLGFHGWLAIAEAYGVDGPEWAADLDDVTILRDAVFELGIEIEQQVLRDELQKCPDTGAAVDLAAIDTRLHYFAEQVRYLSSAAIRRGHRTGLHVPAASAFISHAHEDRKFVNGLVNFLEEHAVNVWLDSSDLKSAAALDGRLSEAIERQERFVVILTEAALASRYVAYELAAAVDLGKDLLPVSMVPIEDLAELRNPTDGRSLYEALLEYPIEESVGKGWMEIYQNVLRSLQQTTLDLTRWRADEGSALAAVLGGLG